MVKEVERFKNVKIRDQVSIVNGVLRQLKVLLLRNDSANFLWSSSTPENVLKEGLSRTISTILGAGFSREGEKWSSSAAQHGIFRNFKISQPSLSIMAPGARLTRAPAAPGLAPSNLWQAMEEPA